MRFDTLIEVNEVIGVSGALSRLFAPRLLRPLYADELDRLERYAQGLAMRVG